MNAGLGQPRPTVMDSSGADRFYFTTDALPARDRFPVFCEEVVRCYTGLDLRTEDQLQFRASVELRRAGAIGIGRNATSRVESARTASLVADGDDSLLVTLVERGHAYQTQLQGAHELRAGDAIICDCGYPGELNIVVDSRFWSLKVPRRLIASLFPPATQFAGARLEKNPMARRLLFHYLSAAVDVDLAGDPATTQIYEDHIVDLIALSLGAGGDAGELAEERGARTARRIAILREIECRSGDPTLSAAAIAALLGITTRYVHLLLEETGRSFTHHVVEKRLQRAVELLRDPQWRHRKIAEIAAESGFTDLSYFNRAFRRRYAATPSDIRQAAHRDE
jgi:AraC-like DNA-binding protein